MKEIKYRLEFITPCFCSGGNQAFAELRASSVRGQLRWWFRALGGSFAEESQIFGRIGKKDEILSSSIVVRTCIIGEPKKWEVPEFSPNDHESYVWHFVKVSGKSANDNSDDRRPGPRWNEDGALASGTKWELRIVIRRSLEEEVQKKFEDALNCFLSLGAIGLRVTRGLGAFVCDELPFKEEKLREVMEKAGFALECKRRGIRTESDLVREIGSLVKGTRKSKGWRNDSDSGIETPSPMGSSQSPRQTSAIWFRPIKNQNGALDLFVFEAPHDRVLGEISKKSVSVNRSPSEIVNAISSRRR